MEETIFKKGDLVEVRNDEERAWEPAIYFAFDDMSEDTAGCGLRHVVLHKYKISGRSSLSVFKYCQYRKPELKVDDPVWVRDSELVSWQAGHFAGWDEDNIKVWSCGQTSHTSSDEWAIAYKYCRTTSPLGLGYYTPWGEDSKEKDYDDGYREGYDRGFEVAREKYYGD